ncbi:uncharacterized protein [Dermacentor albipictus]|uniref:uncharacterized protein n=1 Tax=Dermacentor albipictus TaxID=60249 RepID=UPI0038FD3BB8
MTNEIAAVRTSNTDIHSELEGIRGAMGFMNENFEQFKKDVAGLRREVTEVKTQNSQCQYEIKQMQKALLEAKKEIIELKQYSRSQNVEIKGIPVVPDENLRKSVEKMAASVGVDVSEDDIDVVHRVRSKDKDRPNVVLRFSTRAVRDKFFSAARKARLTTRILGFEECNPVYVNEHLCIENKVLLSKARQLRLEKKWKFAWVSQGKIFMRKTETSTVLRIESDSDLAQIV